MIKRDNHGRALWTYPNARHQSPMKSQKMAQFHDIINLPWLSENQPSVRAAVARRLGWLGLELDEAANALNARSIGAAGARVKILVVATDEESIIADEALSVLQHATPAAWNS